VHVEDVGLRHAKDPAIWDYAVREQRAIITKDDNFVDRWRRSAQGPAVVWLRIGNSANAVLLGWFMPILPAVVVRLQNGDRLIEVR
jgi:predicted nuclease of predicted toxin-antitoxin system